MTPLALALLLTAGQLPTATGEPPQPSPAASALARALHDQPVTPDMLDQVARPFAANLLHTQAAWRGPSCGAETAECRAAADRIARDVAPRLVAERRRRSDRWLAIVIDDTMDADQIRHATAFVATPAGRALAATMAAAAAPASLPAATRARMGRELMQPVAGFDQRAILDRFYDETAALPRATLVAPPAPVPSSQPRRP